jgi:hypothetical protein
VSNGLSRCTLVLDENLNPRLATELTRRGRNATRVQELGLRGSADPQLLDKLDSQLDIWVLVTADDRLPDSHSEAVHRVGATVATINPEREAGWPLEEWRREIVHRWAHTMQDQAEGTLRRYTLRRHGVWRPRRRRASSSE